MKWDWVKERPTPTLYMYATYVYLRVVYIPHVRAGIIYMYNAEIDNCGMSTEKTKLTSNIVNWCKKKKKLSFWFVFKKMQ